MDSVPVRPGLIRIKETQITSKETDPLDVIFNISDAHNLIRRDLAEDNLSSRTQVLRQWVTDAVRPCNDSRVRMLALRSLLKVCR